MKFLPSTKSSLQRVKFGLMFSTPERRKLRMCLKLVPSLCVLINRSERGKLEVTRNYSRLTDREWVPINKDCAIKHESWPFSKSIQL